MIPSQEQQTVIDFIRQGKNVKVNAVAGSGKSTVVLMTAENLPQKRFLQITYNSMLRKEVKEKIEKLGDACSNMDVHTYHSLAVCYYNRAAHKDLEIQHILHRNTEPIAPIPVYDVLILDEVQDMTFLYFSLILKFLHDMLPAPKKKRKTKKRSGGTVQLMVLGDVMQGLYDFKGADIRFLTMAADIWKNSGFLGDPTSFEKCSLQMSYRITNPIADYVNNVMLGEQRMFACKEGDPVVYMRGSRNNLEKMVTGFINQLLKDGTQPDEIFILAASVKGAKSSIRRLENYLVEKGFPCHVPADELEQMDERVIQRKIVFSTFHSVKGRQRKHVFVVGFDNTYLDWFGRKLDRTQCPNTLYVACTRAIERLYLLETSEFVDNRPLDFLKLNHVEMKQQDYIDFRGMHQLQFYEDARLDEKAGEPKTHHITPTELIKFLSEDVIQKCSPLLERIFKQVIFCENPEDVIEIPNIIQTDEGYFEDVSNLNGIAIPCIFFSRLFGHGKGDDVLYRIVKESMKNTGENEYLFLKYLIREKMPPHCVTIPDFLLSANIYSAVTEKLYSKVKQIQKYEWMDEQKMDECIERMKQTIFGETEGPTEEGGVEVEKTIIHFGNDMEKEMEKINRVLNPYFRNDNFKFSARVDLITPDVVWELKFTNSNSIEHFLQVVIYAWIWRTIGNETRDFQLFNIKTGECWLLQATEEELLDIMVILLRGKYGELVVKNDADFLLECVRERERWE